MANKAAIDFGNSNTVLSVWDEKKQSAEMLRIPEYCLPGSFLIPSLISYEPDGRFFIGSQIAQKASAESSEFRWMKRYIGLHSPYALRIGDKRIDARQAAEDFLRTLTAAVFSGPAGQPDELVLSVPVESFEHYSNWFLNGIKLPGNPQLMLIDEATAAAAGHGMSLYPGDSLLVFDFGGSTMQAVCVSLSEGERRGKNGCRVLGKAGCTLGGMTIDRWIYTFLQKKIGIRDNDPRFNAYSGKLLRCCEQVKKQLSANESTVIDFFPDHPFVFTREDLNSLLTEHGLFETMDSVLEEALRTAEDHGMRREELSAVLPVGGSCLIPAVREYLDRRFSSEMIAGSEPLGAVARGAAVIGGGMDVFDFVQHSYAIRFSDPRTGEYAFRTIVPGGTKYPVDRVTNPMRLKASFEGQLRFGIAIYEMQEKLIQPAGKNEIFFDPEGAVHVMPLTEEETAAERLFWMNENNPLFLNSEIPSQKGMPRFEITFGINSNKMLTITALDLSSDRLVLENHPVIRLV